MNKKLQNHLNKLIPELNTSIDAEDLERHSIDALNPNRVFRATKELTVLPQIIIRPKNTNEVAKVVLFSSKEGIPIVPWGGGTGVMGAAASIECGMVLDLKFLNSIESIDPIAQLTVVGAGIVLKDLNTILKTHGMFLGHDPWSLPIATIGGAISTNGVGYLAGKYGSMGEQVLGLEVVLPSGEILQPKLVSKAAGPNLNHLFIGGEGSFGIITKAAIFTPKTPEHTSLRSIGFQNFEQGFYAVQEMQSLGLNPAVVDFAEEFPAESKNRFLRSEITLYLGFFGYREEVLSQRRRAMKICEGYGGKDLGQLKAKRFWNHRHDTGERYKKNVIEGALPPSRNATWRMDYLHVALPSSKVLEYRRECQRLFEAYNIPVREWSLWGRTDLFSFMISNPSPLDDKQRIQVADTIDQILMLAQDLGGTMEYCHGVGMKHLHLFPRDQGQGIKILQKWKDSVDPNGILNPGKLGLR
jgi:FAD/FMN-containing dehydrogenase